MANAITWALGAFAWPVIRGLRLWGDLLFDKNRHDRLIRVLLGSVPIP